MTDVLGWVVGGGGQNVPYELADTEVVRQVRARVRAKATEYGVASPKGEQAQDAGCTEPQPDWPQPNQPHAGTIVVPAAIAASSGGDRKRPLRPVLIQVVTVLIWLCWRPQMTTSLRRPRRSFSC